MFFSRRAQSLMEYALLVSMVVAAVVYMFPRVKRTTQSMIKVAADQIGDQKNAEQDLTSGTSGYLEFSNTSTHSAVDNTRGDNCGTITSAVLERTETSTNSQTNMGFTKD